MFSPFTDSKVLSPKSALMLDFDGIEMSEMLSSMEGCVEMLTGIELSGPLHRPMGLYIIIDKLFGFVQDGLVHDSSLWPNLLHSVVESRYQNEQEHLISHPGQV